ncbi:S9 family peptidase [Botryobacter ruber]|uniref:S9 family peptidase n=1 Tax=Botryobacter ruber TaxID=2171629 RepID=UPI001F0C3F64|nr:S9 family peptidase [Botryobacter ruber]
MTTNTRKAAESMEGGAVAFCKSLCLFLVCLCGAATLQAQGTKADYDRAQAFGASLNDKVYFAPAAFHWLKDEARFWYSHTTPRGKEFVLVDAQQLQKAPAFDHAALAQGLSRAAGKEVEAYKLPFYTLSFADDGKTIAFDAYGKTWHCDLGTYHCQEKPKSRDNGRGNRYWGANRDELSNGPVTSPDGQWVAFIKNFNVYIHAANNKQEEYQLSFDGSEGEFYSSHLEWSPDSRKLATNKVRANKEHLMYFVESSPVDQLQPKLHSRPYLKPGDALPQKKPQLFLIDSKKQVEVDASLVPDQYHLTNPSWRKDSRAFTVEYNGRGHQIYRVVEVDAVTGQARALVDEQAKTFFSYSGKKYRYDVEDGKEIIWASERDGWNHLYRYDGKTGKVKNQITKGEWVVRSVVKVDEASRTIIFEASGREKGQDPYLVQLYRINFDGKGLTRLTSEDGNHKASFSPDFTYFIDSYSRVDAPQIIVLRSTADGKVLLELEKADVTELLKTGWKAPEVFTAKGRDNKTDIWGIIIRPSNFDAAKKYPIIEYIYAGPHDSFVPKSFGTLRWMYELAELGFVVVQLDGMGTSNRSKAFHDVCWQNLKDAGFPDRMAWIKAAAARYPSLDTERVGIFGTSAGGQSAAGALLFHPEFYKVAVSSAGCHDNRMDKIWWNEQWMGKLGPHYAESSNVTNAHKLTGKLMLILGELDDNVDPASTLQLVNALIKANKNFDFLMVPGMGHSGGGDYGEHKRRDFFVKHLLGVEPPEWEGHQTIIPQKETQPQVSTQQQ